MNMNGIKDKVENTVKKVAKNANDVASDTGTEMVKSGKDWVSYIQEHPLQSVLFGIIGYFALKGIVKS